MSGIGAYERLRKYVENWWERNGYQYAREYQGQDMTVYSVWRQGDHKMRVEVPRGTKDKAEMMKEFQRTYEIRIALEKIPRKPEEQKLAGLEEKDG